MKNHILELVAIAMIGDGVLGVLFPKGHARLWKIGPQAWQDATEKFAENPDATRIASAAEIIVGVVLAFAQHEKWEEVA